MDMDYNYLHSTTDAQEWAKAWCEIATRLQSEDVSLIDEGWMIGWFANAIMVGYGAGKRDLINKMLEDTGLNHVLGTV
jgi:hypothetical protein